MNRINIEHQEYFNMNIMLNGLDWQFKFWICKYKIRDTIKYERFEIFQSFSFFYQDNVLRDFEKSNCLHWFVQSKNCLENLKNQNLFQKCIIYYLNTMFVNFHLIWNLIVYILNFVITEPLIKMFDHCIMYG